jgi:hypothetical protein
MLNNLHGLWLLAINKKSISGLFSGFHFNQKHLYYILYMLVLWVWKELMVGFPCVTWIFGVLGEQYEKLCNVKGLVFVEDPLLQNLSLFHSTFYPTLIGRVPIPLMWILNENHESCKTCGKVSIMIPPCTTPIHSSPPISTQNPLIIHYAHIQVEMFH